MKRESKSGFICRIITFYSFQNHNHNTDKLDYLDKTHFHCDGIHLKCK